MDLTDPEARALNAVAIYFETVEERVKERFIYHLVHRYFPKGNFFPLGGVPRFDDAFLKGLHKIEEDDDGR